jgi:hypothetical protein
VTDNVPGLKPASRPPDHRVRRTGRQRDLVGFGDHARVGDDRDISELVGDFERVDHWQHGGGLGPVALEGLNGQWEPQRIGQQAQGDLRLEPAFLGVMPTSA